MLTANAQSANLPARSAAQLLADVKSANVDTLSGTIVEKASLGLPQLPNIGADATTNGSLWGLLTGSHTVRVWLSGPNKQRVALVDATGEVDLFRNGKDLWQWTAAKQQATHVVLPKDFKESRHSQAPSTVTPQQAAQQALAALNPTTIVSTDSARRVANRAAYELILRPRDHASRVGSVRIAIDGRTKVPLSVQVFARGATSPAVDISFTSISFKTPDERNFTFSPPHGASVRQMPFSELFGMHEQQSTDHSSVRTIGKGWTTILAARMPSLAAELSGKRGGNESVAMLFGALKPVSGSWGSGRLFDSALLTGLITNDGRVYVGAVDPSALYQAAAHR